MQKIWMYIIAHFGATCTFLRKSFLVQWGRATRTRQETLEFIAQNAPADLEISLIYH